MHPLLNIAVRAAEKAGEIIRRSFDRSDFMISEKAAHDFVTEIDKKAEQAIIDIIHQAYPSHSILAEESGGDEKGDPVWIIDPLDGTTNFIHQVPHVAVSIAIQKKGKVEHAVVYDPLKHECFTANRGSGAKLNSYRIRVSGKGRAKGILLATGFPFRHRERLDEYFAVFKSLYLQVSDIRRAGTASLDCAYVAAGRYEGYWEMGLAPWDIAAGSLLVEEAGGFVSDFKGKEDYLESGNIVAANPSTFKQILKAIEEAR
ncbi:MAG: inositol monophosphatase [Gammaproteobacteria bacterium]|nr:inositol monophosphatase [Gammaproteobacteria bacterium]